MPVNTHFTYQVLKLQTATFGFCLIGVHWCLEITTEYLHGLLCNISAHADALSVSFFHPGQQCQSTAGKLAEETSSNISVLHILTTSCALGHIICPRLSSCGRPSALRAAEQTQCSSTLPRRIRSHADRCSHLTR